MPGTGEASGGKGDDLYVQALLERYEQDLRGGVFWGNTRNSSER